MGDSTKKAMGMACGSFLFSFLQGVSQMEQQGEHQALESSFAGKNHRWKAYLSNVVGMGNSPSLDSGTFYWDLLKDALKKRLGNQKLCYVKVYAAKSYGEITGECRIDDVKSDELSAMVAEVVKGWDVEQFASHKTFFFLRQEEETTLPNPYFGWQGREHLKSKVKLAAEMFHACQNQNDYESLPDRLAQSLQDATLAQECYSFLPEICAENAFDEISYSETVEIQVGNQPPVLCYKSQLADYWALHSVLFSLFSEGAFGDAANKIYQEYIGVSSIYDVVEQMRKKESKLEDAKLTALRFNTGADFEIR